MPQNNQSSELILYQIRSHALMTVLVLLSLFLVCLLLLEFLLLQEAPVVRTQPGEQQTYQMLDDRGIQKPLVQFKEIIHRPMFYKDRLPLRNQQTTNSRAGPLSDWVLTGVVRTSSQQYALLENPTLAQSNNANAQQRMRLQEKIHNGDWMLIDIQQDKVVFQLDDRTETLMLKVPDKKPSSVKSRLLKQVKRPVRK